MVLGIVIFAASFIIPESKAKMDQETYSIGEDKVKEMVERQVKDARGKIQDIVDETVDYSVEKSERALERISNEKITAVSEFSETVLNDIHKNHEEVMFLYDMLHDKQENLKKTAKEVDQTSALAKETKSELLSAAALVKEETLSSPLLQEKTEEVFQPLKPESVAKEKTRVIEPAAKKTEKKPAAARARKKEKIPSVAALEEGGNNNEVILKLHKEGKSNMAIAKQLGLGIGEVKLVIDLYEVTSL